MIELSAGKYYHFSYSFHPKMLGGVNVIQSCVNLCNSVDVRRSRRKGKQCSRRKGKQPYTLLHAMPFRKFLNFLNLFLLDSFLISN